MRKTFAFILPVVAAVTLAACSASPSAVDYDKAAADALKNSFQARGIATLDRLEQDQANAACAAADISGQPVEEKLAKAIEEANMKTVKWPSDGKFLGDWKQGEVIAQSGRGLTWTDDAKTVNGGNCYNCHQIDKKEISFGTIGTSLYNYGKIRGVTDPNSPQAQDIVKYTWGKIWNSKAYNACSGMPRFGHSGILTEAQTRDLVALLVDPASPVNK